MDVQVQEVDRVFHYSVPDDMPRAPEIGDRVVVPFGHRPRVEGYVVGAVDPNSASAVAGRALKPLIRLLDPEPLLSKDAVDLARWLSEYYLCPLAQALQLFLPPGTGARAARSIRPLVRKGFVCKDGVAEPELVALARRAPKQEAVIRYVHRADRSVTAMEIERALGVSRATIKALVDRGLLREVEVRVERNPVTTSAPTRSPLALNIAQSHALRQIAQGIEDGTSGAILLQGVTGSGKTEVYLQAIERARLAGKGAILLVPEIALTAQTVASFEEYFGAELAVLHSRLSAGERHDQWHKVRRGDVAIVVGARSAIFAPVRNLGLIVVDEEHETSYKQGEAPRYHAREVARTRATRVGAVLVLGSATPALESRHATTTGGLLRVEMPYRVDGRALPRVEIVDMREELAHGNRSMFSRPLRQRLHSAFERGEQALLFINRRGFASFLLCRECGHVPQCTRCEVSLTFHRPDQLRCHYCDAHAVLPEVCPECSGPYLRPFGGGTQRVQEEFARHFPSARHVRMDVDTTGQKGSHARILKSFAAGAYDALIGTQMIAKGLHFPSVTVVGVISADTGLHFPEYRAAERTFQLLTQVAGRSGRGDREGLVVVQTYDPDHYAVQAASRHDYEGFFAQEMAYRKRAGYPPHGSLVRCLWSSEDEQATVEACERGARLVQSVPTDVQPEVVGPCPAPLSKLQDRYRWHVLLRGRSETTRAAARAILEGERWNDHVRLSVDVDPVSLL